MRAIKIALVSLALLLGGVATYVWSRWQPCSTVRECYRSWKAFTSNEDAISSRRSASIDRGFTASATSIAFPAPLSIAADGLVIVDRAKKQAKVIASEGFTHTSPRFSSDGERLLFVRKQPDRGEDELISCRVSDWHCTLLLRTTGSISSPVDIGNGNVLFGFGDPVVRDGKVTRYRSFDFHIISAGHPPKKLTDFGLVYLDSIGVGTDAIYFSAAGAKAQASAGCLYTLKCDTGDIFTLQLGHNEAEILRLSEKLKPVVLIGGLSLKPALSGDGARLAFLNTTRDGNPWRYNMKIFSDKGALMKTIFVSGIAFSSGAFVGNTFLVNELFEGTYRVSQFDQDFNLVDSIEIDNSPEFLARVPHIGLVFDDEKRDP